MNWIPSAKSGKWLIVALLSTALSGIGLCLVRFYILGQPWSGTHVFRFILLGTVFALIFSAAGWLGARLLWLLANAGMLAGLIVMASYPKEMTGFEDLSSLLSFMLLTVLGVAAGIVAELALVVVRRLRA